MLTRRCLGRHFLLRPDPALNKLFSYCLALAAEKHGFELHALAVMSNHYHIVATDVRGVLPDFLMGLNRALAMAVKRLRGWDEVVWEPNVGTSAVELIGRAEVLDKVAYTMLNPVSAGLVCAPEHWPGVLSTCDELRVGFREAKRPPFWFSERAPERAVVRWGPPRGFENQGAYLAALERLLHTRLGELVSRHRREGHRYLGPSWVARTRPTDRPKTKKTRRQDRRPTFSAVSLERWRLAVERLRAFQTAYRLAYAKWRAGREGVEFPVGTWWVVRFAGASVVQ